MALLAYSRRGDSGNAQASSSVGNPYEVTSGGVTFKAGQVQLRAMRKEFEAWCKKDSMRTKYPERLDEINFLLMKTPARSTLRWTI